MWCVYEGVLFGVGSVNLVARLLNVNQLGTHSGQVQITLMLAAHAILIQSSDVFVQLCAAQVLGSLSTTLRTTDDLSHFSLTDS